MHRAEELAEELDISIRTLYRRVKSGEVEAIDTISGRRYRLANNARPAPHSDSNIQRAPRPLPSEEDALRARVKELEDELSRLRRTVEELVDWTSVASRCLHDLSTRG